MISGATPKSAPMSVLYTARSLSAHRHQLQMVQTKEASKEPDDGDRDSLDPGVAQADADTQR